MAGEDRRERKGEGVAQLFLNKRGGSNSERVVEEDREGETEETVR